MRVRNPAAGSISYRLNLLGIRVYPTWCQLVARSGDQWMPIGPPRELPVEVPSDAGDIGSDTLLATAYQYDAERPGSDLREVLAQRKRFDQALADRSPNDRTVGADPGWTQPA